MLQSLNAITTSVSSMCGNYLARCNVHSKSYCLDPERSLFDDSRRSVNAHAMGHGGGRAHHLSSAPLPILPQCQSGFMILELNCSGSEAGAVT